MNGSGVILCVLLWSIQSSAGEQDMATESDCKARPNGTKGARGSQYLQRGRTRAGVALEADADEEAKLCACAPQTADGSESSKWTSTYEDMSIEHGIGSCSDTNDFRFSGWYKNGGAGSQEICENGCTAADDCVGYEYESSWDGRCMLRYDEKAATTMKTAGPSGYSQENVVPAAGEVTGTDEWANATCYRKVPTGDKVGDCDCATATTTNAPAIPTTLSPEERQSPEVSQNVVSGQYYIEDGCRKTQVFNGKANQHDEQWRAALTDADKKAAFVRCCDDSVINPVRLMQTSSTSNETAEKGPEEAGTNTIWNPCVSEWPDKGQTGGLTDNEKTGQNGWNCPKKTTWYKANELCQRIGKRLCTVAEIQSNFCCGSGCGLDQKMVWTADSTTTTTTVQMGLVATGIPSSCKSKAPKSEANNLFGAKTPMDFKQMDKQSGKAAVICCYSPQEPEPESMLQTQESSLRQDDACVTKFKGDIPNWGPKVNQGKWKKSIEGVCMWEANYGAAANHCKRNGLRLCEKRELEQAKCCVAIEGGCRGKSAGFPEKKNKFGKLHTFAERDYWVADDLKS